MSGSKNVAQEKSGKNPVKINVFYLEQVVYTLMLYECPTGVQFDLNDLKTVIRHLLICNMQTG